MAIGAYGATPNRNETRYGLALALILIMTSGCVTQVESPTFPIPVAGPDAVPFHRSTPISLFSAAAVTDSAQEEPFDPFAKPGESGIDEYDPWEPLNTKVFEFNRQIDRWILKPVARAYNFIMPDQLQLGVSNFFYNIRVTPRFVNNVAQGKVKGAGIEVGRFLINTTVGLAGFIDVAERLDLRTPEEDTGQTLGFYGIPSGPYLVLPLMQPFTVRDLAGYVADIFLNPVYWLVLPIIEVDAIPSVVPHKDRVTTSLILVTARVTEVVNDRSLNLEKYQGVEEATLDLYSAVRNAYLQKRAKAVQE
jgi:phospholipid-binding lipoprotein MlaA